MINCGNLGIDVFFKQYIRFDLVIPKSNSKIVMANAYISKKLPEHVTIGQGLKDYPSHTTYRPLSFFGCSFFCSFLGGGNSFNHQETRLSRTVARLLVPASKNSLQSFVSSCPTSVNMYLVLFRLSVLHSFLLSQRQRHAYIHTYTSTHTQTHIR